MSREQARALVSNYKSDNFGEDSGAGADDVDEGT